MDLVLYPMDPSKDMIVGYHNCTIRPITGDSIILEDGRMFKVNGVAIDYSKNTIYAFVDEIKKESKKKETGGLFKWIRK